MRHSGIVLSALELCTNLALIYLYRSSSRYHHHFTFSVIPCSRIYHLVAAAQIFQTCYLESSNSKTLWLLWKARFLILYLLACTHLFKLITIKILKLQITAKIQTTHTEMDIFGLFCPVYCHVLELYCMKPSL